jgi:hypothetical protein
VKLIIPVDIYYLTAPRKYYEDSVWLMRLFAQCRYAYIEASIPAGRQTFPAKAVRAGAPAGKLHGAIAVKRKLKKEIL